MSQKTKQAFAIIDQNSVNSTWNGAPTTINTNNNVLMPQTTNGTMIVALTNQSSQNNQGTVSLTSGGSVPVFINVPALANQPTILTQNFQANSLSLTNISANSSTPILVQAVGPGLPGVTFVPLTIGTATTLSYGAVAQGTASPQFMQLVLQATGSTLAIFGVIGGPVDAKGNNGYVIAVNAAQNTGPGTGVEAPAGYYATTSSNTYAFQFNWGSSIVFVANLSPLQTTVPITALLRQL